MKLLDGNFRYKESRQKILKEIENYRPYFQVKHDKIFFRTRTGSLEGLLNPGVGFYLLTPIMLDKARYFGFTKLVEVHFDNILRINLSAKLITISTENLEKTIKIADKEETGLWRFI